MSVRLSRGNFPQCTDSSDALGLSLEVGSHSAFPSCFSLELISNLLLFIAERSGSLWKNLSNKQHL